MRHNRRLSKKKYTRKTVGETTVNTNVNIELTDIVISNLSWKNLRIEAKKLQINTFRKPRGTVERMIKRTLRDNKHI